MLGIPNDKRAFSVLLAFDKLKPRERRVDVDKRNCVVAFALAIRLSPPSQTKIVYSPDLFTLMFPSCALI